MRWYIVLLAKPNQDEWCKGKCSCGQPCAFGAGHGGPHKCFIHS